MPVQQSEHCLQHELTKPLLVFSRAGGGDAVSRVWALPAAHADRAGRRAGVGHPGGRVGRGGAALAVHGELVRRPRCRPACLGRWGTVQTVLSLFMMSLC